MLRSRRKNDETVFDKDQFEILEKLRKAKNSYDVVDEEYEDILSKKRNADGNLNKEACNEILDWIRNHSKKGNISINRAYKTLTTRQTKRVNMTNRAFLQRNAVA